MSARPLAKLNPGRTFVFVSGAGTNSESKTMWARVKGRGYKLLAPPSPLLRRIAPKYMTTTAEVGRAMLHVAREGWPTAVLENADIVAAGSR